MNTKLIWNINPYYIIKLTNTTINTSKQSQTHTPQIIFHKTNTRQQSKLQISIGEYIHTYIYWIAKAMREIYLWGVDV